MSIETEFDVALVQARQGLLEFSQLLIVAESLASHGLSSQATVLYKTWLKHNLTPYNHFGQFNLGVLLFDEGDMAGAKEAYGKAIQLVPAFVQPHFNLGLVHENSGQIEAAISEWQWIDEHVSTDDAAFRPLLLASLNNLGRIFEVQKHFYQAYCYFTRSLYLEPNQPDVLHHWVFLREKQCAWPVYEPLPGVSKELMAQSTSVLALLSLTDDPEVQLEAARAYSEKKFLTRVPSMAASRDYGHRKLRIGYCSSDFCLHPVAMLTVELFELHDRENFEIFGYCWTQKGDSALRRRIINAMDHFEQIGALSDEAAAHLIREHEIDILVDLQGLTLGARGNFLAYRPAPVQVTFLGLPATSGLSSIDFVIADRFLIPEEFARFYTEKPLYMPDVFQVSDRQRKNASIPSRESCRLPSEGFIFCSFNNNFKYTPECFDTWMNILRMVPGSVLWILADNPRAEENLRNEAKIRTIEANRLIFSPWVERDQFLACLAVADLFLDTFPFNAGTTANDALWMGLPVLTRCGRSFASRMAGSLLTAAGLPELITHTWRDYEEKAVSLANAPDQCRRLREHLREVRATGVLFDTPVYVRHLEKHFRKLIADLR